MCKEGGLGRQTMDCRFRWGCTTPRSWATGVVYLPTFSPIQTSLHLDPHLQKSSYRQSSPPPQQPARTSDKANLSVSLLDLQTLVLPSPRSPCGQLLLLPLRSRFQPSPPGSLPRYSRCPTTCLAPPSSTSLPPGLRVPFSQCLLYPWGPTWDLAQGWRSICL